MCGRFTLATDLDEIIDRFEIGVSIGIDQYQHRYNIAPSQQVLSVVNDGTQNRLGYLRWGLVPSWSKELSIGHKMINARSETITEKPSFKHAVQKRRCLVIADGFYEWKKDEKVKQPMMIRLKDNAPFAMAGIWERWVSPTNQEIFTCSVITTKPNKLMELIHDRMPVILRREDEKTWLNRSIEDTEELKHLLVPYADHYMKAYEVSSQLNSPKHDTKEMILPV